jgi:two-component system phosphate regulon sensor histidine kinase PhoR
MGVAKADHKRIFEKFYRAENSLVHETKGSGLGLSLVQHIAEAHGGSVKVDSAPGKGSTFTLVLPLTHREAVKAPNLARATKADA